jgi:hypothetical protein
VPSCTTQSFILRVDLSHASYANLAVEGELAVRLGDAAEIARVFPVIELHNYVFRSETPNLQELIANRRPARRRGAPEHGRHRVARRGALDGLLRVEINGKTVEEGSMSGVPAVRRGRCGWLRGHLEAHGLTPASRGSSS